MGGETRNKPSGSSYPKLATGPVGQQIHSIYKDRLGQFTSGGQYESQYLLGYDIFNNDLQLLGAFAL